MHSLTRYMPKLIVASAVAASMMLGGVPASVLAEESAVSATEQTNASEQESTSGGQDQTTSDATAPDASVVEDPAATSAQEQDAQAQSAQDQSTLTEDSSASANESTQASDEAKVTSDSSSTKDEASSADKDGEAKAASEAAAPGVVVTPHVQNIGWMGEVRDGQVAGTFGRALRVEALRMHLENASGSLRYRSHVQNEGWQGWVADGEVTGSTGKGRRVEAFSLELTGDIATTHDVYYRVHVQNIGWMGWAKNGETAGTAGRALRVEAIQVVLVAKGADAPSSEGQATDAHFAGAEEARVSAHVQNIGWMGAVGNGQVAGTTGRGLRVEAFRISLAGSSVPGDIVTSAHVQNIGWTGEVGGGQVVGTTGRALRVEALKMRLTGEAASTYDLYYRAHVQNVGWLAWAAEGEVSGSEGMALRVEAVQVLLVPEGAGAPSDEGAALATPSLGTLSVGYSAFVSGSWQGEARDGGTAGTTGQCLPITGFRANVEGAALAYGGGISYSTHVQDVGWMDWASDGAESGVIGEKNVEAIQIKLEGAPANYYNVWYRVHVQDYGWLGWAKNGEKAGTVGFGKRVEAIQIILRGSGAGAPGSTTRRYMDGTLRAGLNAASGQRSINSFGGYSASSGVVNRLQNAVNGIRGQGYDVGFIMMDIDSHQGVSYNCDALFYSASSIKAPYIASVVNEHPDAVSRYAYDITETLYYSWDYNYKNVLNVYGKGPMRTWCAEAGVRASVAEQLPWVDYSARDLAKLWARTYVLYSESSEGEQLGRWCERPNVSTIHSTLGNTYRTRSKAGWIDAGGSVRSGINGGGQYWRVSIDGGIVYAHNGAYVMAIMSSVPANHDMLNGLTSAINAAHNEM